MADEETGRGLTPERPLALAVGGLLALAAAIGIGRFVYTPILPPMVAALGLSKSEAGLIASTNFVGYLAGALAGGLVTGRSARLWLIAALAISVATSVLTGRANALAEILVLRFAGGVASAFVLVLSTVLVLERLAAMGRPQLADLHFAGVGAGIAGSAILVAALQALGADWRQLWEGAGMVAGIASLAAVMLIPPADGQAVPGPAAGGSGRWTMSHTRYAAAYGLFGFGYVITATFLVAIVRADDAMRPLEPAVWMVVGLAAVPSVAAWGRYGRRVGIAKAFAVASVVEALGVLACTWPGGIAGALIAALALGATVMGITALGLMGARSLDPGVARRAVALMTAAFGTGQILGPLMAGVLIDRTGGFTVPIVVASAGLLLAAVVVPRPGMAALRAPNP